MCDFFTLNNTNMKNEELNEVQTTEQLPTEQNSTQLELQLEETATETPTEQPKPKRTTKKAKKEVEKEVEIEIEDNTSEIEKLREMLKNVEAERDKLASECTSLNDTVKTLQEEVKITPKKLAKVVQDMGIAPLAISRENAPKMTIETYNAMTDSQRREWQRTNRSDYLEMMHNVKIGK